MRKYIYVLMSVFFIVLIAVLAMGKNGMAQKVLNTVGLGTSKFDMLKNKDIEKDVLDENPTQEYFTQNFENKEEGMLLSSENQENYNLLNTIKVDELNITFYEMEHIKTKSKIIFADCDDKNKTFTIAFKTLPEDEKGMPHIMEHSMLCGSKKYNVKDPFFTLVKTSLATFLNAFTAPDTTFYPLSSVNDQDFKNMMDVYLDAVFNPNFINNPNILKQEGWHYEFDENDNINATGVVFNEMKGELSTPMGVLEIAQLKDIYPGTTYAHNYGGDPEGILDLTQDEFVEFYNKYYHPSNAIIYLYGDIDINDRLSYMNDEYLSKYDYKEILYPNDKVDINLIQDGQYYYNDNSGAKDKSIIAYNIGLDDFKDNKTDIIIKLLAYILFNKEGATITDKLKKDGFGEEVSCYYENGNTSGYVSIISRNIDDSKKEAFREKIEEYLNEVKENGIPEKELKSAINMSYLKAAEPTDGGYTRGIYIFMNLLTTYRYGFGIENHLLYEDVYKDLFAEDLSNKDNSIMKVFNEIFMEPYYKNMTVVSPKKDLNAETEGRIKKILENRKNKMIDDGRLEDEKNAYKELTNWMAMPDSQKDIANMPKLTKDSIDRNIESVTYQLKNIEGKNVIYTEENVGGLIYVGVNYLLPNKENMKKEDIYMINMMTKLLGSLDTENYTYKDLNTELGLYAGNFVTGVLFTENQSVLNFSIKTTKEHLKESYDLLYEILYKTKFDDKNRILEKLKEMKIGSNISIIDDGHASVLYRAKSNDSYMGELSDKIHSNGIAFNMFINDMVREYNEKSDDFTKALYDVRDRFMNSDNIVLDVCCNYDDYGKYEEETIEFLDVASASNKNSGSFDFSNMLDFDKYEKKDKTEVFVADTSVNFVSRVGHSDISDRAMLVLNNIITYDYLYPKIRVEGGAYGQGAHADRNSNIGCYSYRDPRFKETDEVYKNIYNNFKDMVFTDEMINENIIGTMKNVDIYPLPKEEHQNNISYYLSGHDNEFINSERHQILDLDNEKIKQLLETYKSIWDDSNFCAIISSEYEEEAKENYGNIKRLNFE